MRTIGRTRLRCSGPACLPRRGRKAEDDRRFLEALHFFTVENVRWRALPERFGHWNSVSRRFGRLSSSTRCLDEFHGASYSDVRLHRRARACVGGRSKGGKKGKRSGVRVPASHENSAKSDASGDILAFGLTGGQAFDGHHFETLFDIAPNIPLRAVICDKGYACKGLGTPRERAASLPSSPTRPTKRTSQPSSHSPSTRPAPASSRASDGSSASSGSRSDAISTDHRQLRRRPWLDQTRPHG
jgi:transposase